MISKVPGLECREQEPFRCFPRQAHPIVAARVAAQIFSNELVIARGVDSDLAMTGATCSLKLALSSNTAKASTGQSCSMTNPDGNEISRILDIEIVLNANRTVADVTWKIESVRSLTPAAVTCEFTGISFTYQKQ